MNAAVQETLSQYYATLDPSEVRRLEEFYTRPLVVAGGDRETQFRLVDEFISRTTDSYSRMGTVLSFISHKGKPEDGLLSFEEGLRLLGNHWSTTENIRDYLPVLRKLLGTHGPLDAMMDEAEIAAYAELPEIVTVFRGCDLSKLTGASWSLDENVANSFPFLDRYKVPDPVVVEAKVSKSRILALKLDRDEAEIITFSARRTRVQCADEARAKRYWAARDANV